MTARRSLGRRAAAAARLRGLPLLALLAACDSSKGGGGDAATGEVGDGGSGDAGVEAAVEAGRGEEAEAGPPGAWVYAGGSQRIDLFAADLATGVLTLRDTVAAGDDARLAELDPSGRRLYVQSQVGTPYAVLTYGLDRRDGRLQPGPVLSLPFPGVEGVTQMQVHPSAPWFMLSASNADPGLEDRLMPLDGGGALGSHRTVSYLFYGFTWDPSGKFFYGLDGEAIFQYRFDSAAGTLSEIDPPLAEDSEGRVVLSLRPHPAGTWVYSVEESELGAYRFDPATGRLTQPIFVPRPLPEEPAYWTAAAVHPDGRLLYVLGYLTEGRAAIIDLFQVAMDTGELTFVSRQGGPRDGQRQVQNTGLQGPLLVGDLLIIGGPHLSGTGNAALVVYRMASGSGQLQPLGAPVPMSPAARSAVGFLFSAPTTP